MEDIGQELLEKIRDYFVEEFNKNVVLSKIYEKIRRKIATYEEANEFAIILGEILAKAYKENLSSDVLPDGRMYYNIANRIIPLMMENNYELIADVTNEVQQLLNEKAHIGIKAITPELNVDRIDKIVDRVANAELYDEIAWILDEPMKNFSQSIVDDSIRVNAEFHAKSGLQPKIVRKVAGDCCEWCKAIEGIYSYPDDVPRDVYRRHQRCRCVVLFDPKDGKIQNVHSKQWIDEEESNRIEYRKLAEKKEVKSESPQEKEKRIAEKYGLEDPEKRKEKRIEKSKKLAKKYIETFEGNSTIKLEDIIIHKSIGAKVKNYDVIEPETGEYFHFVEGTRIQNAQVFAGKGAKKTLHEGVAEGLSEQLGGKPENWQHCKGYGILDYYGEEREAEVHWFQEETVGKVKFKVKRWEDES